MFYFYDTLIWWKLSHCQYLDKNILVKSLDDFPDNADRLKNISSAAAGFKKPAWRQLLACSPASQHCSITRKPKEKYKEFWRKSWNHNLEEPSPHHPWKLNWSWSSCREIWDGVQVILDLEISGLTFKSGFSHVLHLHHQFFLLWFSSWILTPHSTWYIMMIRILLCYMTRYLGDEMEI